MNWRVFPLRLACWIGAIFDGLMIVPMMSPKAMAVLYGVPGFDPGVEYRVAMAIGSSLMAGWTVLLIWAQMKPVERRGVMLMTLFPVLSCLIASCIYGVTSGFVSPGRMAPTWIMQGLLFVLDCAGLALIKPLAAEAGERNR